MADFRGYVTAAGQTFEALAKQMGYPVTIGFIEVGDGKLPDSESPIDRTQLVHKLKQFPAIVEQDAKNPGQWVATCYIPADDAINGAGYFIREIGCKLIDRGAGVLYAYRRVSDDWKPVLTSGEAKSFIYKLRFIPTNGELLTPTIDPSVVLVDKEELARVMGQHKASTDHPYANETEKGFSRLATQQEVNENKSSDDTPPVVTVDKLWDWAAMSGGKVPHVFSVWKRSLAEAGYDLIGRFGMPETIQDASQVLLSIDGTDAYAWTGEIPKEVDKNSSPEDGGWRSVKEDSLRKNIKSDLVKCKYGSLNVFTDMTAYGPSVGIKTTNTPTQNTAALEAIRQIKGLRLNLPAGTFQFDVFRTAGLLEVFGAGKDLTLVTLTAVGSQVSVQFDKSTVRGIHFKSVAGSLEWQRTTYGTNVELFDCKISNFMHESPAPNSWGAYFKDAKNCKLTRVEFDGNSQSDIAILEGTENLVIDGCFHSSGQLFINLEPNDNYRRMRGIELRNMDINKLSILNNDLNNQAEDVVSVIGCAVGTLLYDGLGTTFINTSISKVIPSPDNQMRSYGADVRGLRVDTRELVPDPIFSSLSSPGGSSGWTTGYVTLPPVDRYNRNAEGALVLNPNVKTGLVWLYSGKFAVQDNTSYLISLCRTVMLPGSRPDIHYIKFFDASQAEIPNTSCTINQYVSPNGDKKLFRTVFKTPPGTAYVELVMQNDDSSNHQQTVAYHFVSVRKILTNGNGVDCVTVNYENNLRRISLPLTKAQFDAAQYYYCPLPVGSEIEFAYSAGGARLAKVVAKAADNTGKFGTLQIIANYP